MKERQLEAMRAFVIACTRASDEDDTEVGAAARNLLKVAVESEETPAPRKEPEKENLWLRLTRPQQKEVERVLRDFLRGVRVNSIDVRAELERVEYEPAPEASAPATRSVEETVERAYGRVQAHYLSMTSGDYERTLNDLREALRLYREERAAREQNLDRLQAVLREVRAQQKEDYARADSARRELDEARERIERAADELRRHMGAEFTWPGKRHPIRAAYAILRGEEKPTK